MLCAGAVATVGVGNSESPTTRASVEGSCRVGVNEFISAVATGFTACRLQAVDRIAKPMNMHNIRNRIEKPPISFDYRTLAGGRPGKSKPELINNLCIGVSK